MLCDVQSSAEQYFIDPPRFHLLFQLGSNDHGSTKGSGREGVGGVESRESRKSFSLIIKVSVALRA